MIGMDLHCCTACSGCCLLQYVSCKTSIAYDIAIACLLACRAVPPPFAPTKQVLKFARIFAACVLLQRVLAVPFQHSVWRSSGTCYHCILPNPRVSYLVAYVPCFLLPDSSLAGTLTENRMTVVAGYFCGRLYKELPSLKELPREAGEEIALNAALNSKVCLLGWV